LFFGGARGQEGSGRIFPQANFSDNFNPVHVRHGEIGDHHANLRMLAPYFNPLAAAGCEVDRISLQSPLVLKQVALRAFVFNDQDRRLGKQG